MSTVVVCLDCQHYQTGGYCRKKRRDVGALNPACDKALSPTATPEDTEQAEPLPNLPPTKKCRKCRQELPLTEFEYTKSNKGEKIRRHTCKTCYTQAMSKNGKKKNKTTIKIEKPMETIPTKRCSKCGEEKPLAEFYKDKKAKDGLQSWCKLCTRRDITARARKKKAELREERLNNTPATVVVREALTDAQMVMALRAHGWQVQCTRVITEEL